MSDLLYKISTYGLIVPIFIGIYHHKHLNKSMWWYFWSMISVYIGSIISLKLSEQHINNHFMMYINASLIMILRTCFFYTFLLPRIYKNALIINLILYLSGICIDIYLQGIYMNQYLFIVADVWATFFLLVALNQILKDESLESLSDLPIFWVILGTLIFVIFDFFLSVANAWLYAVNRAFLFLLWDYITPIFMLIRIVLVSIGYWKTKYYAENLVNR